MAAFSSVPLMISIRSAPPKERGRGEDEQREGERPELHHQDEEDERGGDREHGEELAEGALLRFVLPAASGPSPSPSAPLPDESAKR